MSIKQVLSGIARMYQKHPERWTKNKVAANAIGICTNIDSNDAYAFCAAGALGRAKLEGNLTAGEEFSARKLMDKAALELYGSDVITVNDTRGRLATIAVLKKAARLA